MVEYYNILKILEIKYINDDDEIEIINIEIDNKICYFDYESESDSENENYNYRKYVEDCLKIKYKPKILFENKKWKSKRYQEMYEGLILNEIKDGIFSSIVKKEIRYIDQSYIT